MTAFAVTAAAMAAGVRIFPGFRSAEQKQGEYRSDGAQLGASTRLPSAGGPGIVLGLSFALALAVEAGAVGLDLALPFLALCWLQGGLGWLDDLAKSRGQGLSERAKLAWLLLVAIAWSAWYAWAWLGPAEPLFQRVSWLLVATAYLLWITLCVSFSDGVDGLTSGVCAISSVPFVVAVAASRLGLGMLGGATLGAALGALLLNQPSRWTRRGTAPRRARAYLGDSGALVLGSALGALTVLSGWEWLWLLAGAALVVEGTSVLVQTGILVPLFRRVLTVTRFRGNPTLVPHTDFPLPFLATPFHHHLSLAGLGPLQTVFWLYAVAGVGALLSIFEALAPWRASRPIAVVAAAALYVAVLLWSLASKGQFLRWREGDGGATIVAYRGVPYEVGRLRLYAETGERVCSLPCAARGSVAPWLDRRLGRHDVAAILGLCAWLAGDREAAVRRWQALPVLTLLLREDVAVLAAEHARSTGQLDGLLHSWRQALGQVYQAGRLEIVCARLARVAAVRALEALGVALCEHTSPARRALATDPPRA